MMVVLEHWRALLDDLGEDGWVRHESYEAFMKKNKLLNKSCWLKQDEEDYILVDYFCIPGSRRG